MTRPQVAGIVGAVLLATAGGGALVERFRPPRVVTVEDTRAKEQLKQDEEKISGLVQELIMVRRQLVDLQQSRTVTEDTARRPDGTVTRHKVTQTETTRKTETNTETKKDTEKHEQVATQEDRTVEVDQRRTVISAPEGRWSVRVLAGVDTAGSVLAGAAFDYRLAGPFAVGAWATAPIAGAPGRWTAGASLGLRLP